jgi:transcriptional regulator with XRE-family HTH domain
MAIEVEAHGRFGNALSEALAKKGLSIRELAIKTDGTYEHMRKLLKGLAYPSKYLLKAICDVTGMKFSEAEALLTQDKMEHKFGKSAHLVMKRDPRSAEFDELIPYLSDDQREMFLTQMRAVVKGNRRAKA